MPAGAGKYDDLATVVRVQARARGVLVMVIEGALGNGFSVQATDMKVLAPLPGLLREMADEIERDQKGGGDGKDS